MFVIIFPEQFMYCANKDFDKSFCFVAIFFGLSSLLQELQLQFKQSVNRTIIRILGFGILGLEPCWPIASILIGSHPMIPFVHDLFCPGDGAVV
jgi:hypothetical protein